LIKAGLIDPAKVSQTALQKAASVAGMLLIVGLIKLRLNETRTA
jgi:chaperonin GroEL (HSP60 family)